ncbi:MAG: putative protein involved in outer rane biosis, partial [Acidobacteria bacterium]|nr:putative protein involved in outer rane biosis [Acidobacteriota bacterium]
EYGGDRVRVQGLQLVSGPQRIEVDGTIGTSDSRLRAGLRNIDLARLDTGIVGDRRLGGVLNASARVTGPRDSLRVDADFSVDNGAFRAFRYQSLAGTAGFAGRQLSLDARLQQAPQTWLVARGTVPAALFQAAAPGRPALAGASDPVDFTVQSSSIDLGLVQGFTTAVEKVSGTVRADVRITGTADAPALDGFVEVAQGALTVPASGVAYSQLDGRVALRGDRAVIERLSVTDEHGKALTVSGEVAARGKAIGDLKAAVKSDGFELLHNDLGRVVVDADLRVGGQLKALRVEGDISMERAEIALDQALEMERSSVYSTTPARSPVGDTTDTVAAGPPDRAVSPAASTAPASARPAAAPAAPRGAGGAEQPSAPAGPFDAAQADVRVRIPDVLIVKGKDIRPPGGSPIGLGDVNITLGGSLRVRKAAGGAPEVVGDVRTVRGTYDFKGRRFDLQRDGRVRFEGLTPIDPSLDLTAVRVIRGVEARVHVGGTMRRPELTLSSQPAMDEADILSLIVFNQPANQLGAGEAVSLSQQASALAASFVASKLADSLGRALDLDIFEIEAAPAGAGQGAFVTVGEQVGQRLFVRLRQGVGADTATSFIMEYQLLDFLRLETTVSQGGNTTRSMLRRIEGSGLDMIFFFTY